MIELNKSLFSKQIVKFLGKANNNNNLVRFISSIDDISDHCFSFATKLNEELVDKINRCKQCTIILKVPLPSDKNHCIITHDNPKLAFSQVINSLIPETNYNPNTTFLSHNNQFIGRNSKIHDSAKVGNNVVIGKNCIIMPNAVIHNNVTIGDGVVIDSGSVIGSRGFGFTQNKDSSWVEFPQIAGVTIEDNVYIGSNTCIDSGSLTRTIIGKGTKIDNLVHIGHNCKIGKNCIITASSCISGSVVIGDNNWVGPNSSIINKCVTGENVTIGIGTNVLKDCISDSRVCGNPALPTKQFGKMLFWIKKTFK